MPQKQGVVFVISELLTHSIRSIRCNLSASHNGGLFLLFSGSLCYPGHLSVNSCQIGSDAMEAQKRCFNLQAGIDTKAVEYGNHLPSNCAFLKL